VLAVSASRDSASGDNTAAASLWLLLLLAAFLLPVVLLLPLLLATGDAVGDCARTGRRRTPVRGLTTGDSASPSPAAVVDVVVTVDVVGGTATLLPVAEGVIDPAANVDACATGVTALLTASSTAPVPGPPKATCAYKWC
jgi:hypothetical protein